VAELPGAEEDYSTEQGSVAEDIAGEDDFADFEASSEFDLNELEDLPDFTTDNDTDIATDAIVPTSGQEIDLEQLAAADDEFDFLAGTDECATKLDLARAYLDMEDSDGAKELLQEVVAEGSDQQKHDARALMDSIG
jgi:pilus assembly protein FimV